MRKVDIWNTIIALVGMSLVLLWKKPTGLSHSEDGPSPRNRQMKSPGAALRGVCANISQLAWDIGARVLESVHGRLARLVRPPWLFVTVAAYLLVFSVILQTNIRSAFVIAGYVGLTLWAIAYPKLGMGIVLVWLAWTLYDFAGSPHPILDLGLLTLALGASVLLTLGVRQRRLALRWPTDGEALLMVGLFLPVAWVLVSIGDALSPTNVEFQSSSPANNDEGSAPPKIRVGLAISGGGYRAALFHAGVVAALEELHDPIEVMSSVSGGSIFGSFYARGGTPQKFEQAVVQGSINLERYVLRIDNALCLLASVRIPVGDSSFSLLPFFRECSRTTMQSDLLRRTLLGSVLDRDGSVEGRPELMLGTTDIAGHRMIGLTPHGFVNIYLSEPLDRFSFANPSGVGGSRNQAIFFPEHLAHLPGEQQLSALVAASGAFPGALPAYRLWAPYTLKGHPPHTFGYLLADGGLTDNSGMILLDAAQLLAAQSQRDIEHPFPNTQNPPNEWHISRWNVDLILASDAGAYTLHLLPSSGFAEFVRAIDVMSEISGGADMFAERDQTKDPRPPIVLLSPRSFVPNPPILDNGHLLVFLPGTSGFQVASKQYSVPLTIGEDTLQYVIDHMEADARAEAEPLLAGLVKDGIVGKNGISDVVSDALLRSRDSAGLEKLAKLDRLCELIKGELKRRLVTFILTPTLRDQFDQETARSIFILGEYAVRWNQIYIDCFLTKLREAKQPGAIDSTQACRSLPGGPSVRAVLP
ncbi:MAG TPA: patatin-like phospholipase family protein [Xanthobacteraceae bacterium]